MLFIEMTYLFTLTCILSDLDSADDADMCAGSSPTVVSDIESIRVGVSRGLQAVLHTNPTSIAIR